VSGLLRRCYAVQCPNEVPANLLMCIRHWRMVPKEIQVRVWAAYVPGQETRKDPSLLWCMAADDAVAHVAGKEGRTMRPADTFVAAFYPAGRLAVRA